MAQGALGLVQARGIRFSALATSLHALGGAIGGALTVLGLWLILTPVRTLLGGIILTFMAAFIALGSLTADLGGSGRRRNPRQVPARWVGRYGPLSAYFRYGLMLGSGVLTHIPNYLGPACLFTAALVLPFDRALLVGASFGMSRTGSVAILAVAAWIVKGLSERYGRWSRFVRYGSGLGGVILFGLSIANLARL